MPYLEEIFEAEGRYLLAEEGDDFGAREANFTGLRAMNATRWNSVIKMGRSHLKYKGLCKHESKLCNFISMFRFNHTYMIFPRSKFTDIIRRCLEKNKEYDLIMRADELLILEDLVELLEVFQIFTTYIQGEKYPTLNSMVLFRTEIIKK